MQGNCDYLVLMKQGSNLAARRLDAVQDLIDHPTFREDFSKLVKGVPDLERIVSRIHAKNCKVKDFLQVLNVRCSLSGCGDRNRGLCLYLLPVFQKAEQRLGHVISIG